ncbi:uncharacterized protein LOC123017913 [Varanus komodoensis]|uniref:uncharacterized protein LOC123017913 n=1 Tax=Varanus komodoensis TaxID=61221 RepID=UPI001CF7AAD0|nr:uncharacterized protein LOC123017913 [Varanus komodoensis]
MKSLLSFLLPMAALAAAELGVPEEEARIHGTASEVHVPCNLKGVMLTWYWIPLYPRCADIKGNEKKTICSLISNQTHKDPKNRFEMRSEVKLQEGNSRATLILRALYMNDSGDFYCSNSKKDSPRVTVTVKSGNQNGILVEYFKCTRHKYWQANLTCNSCEYKRDAEVHQDGAIKWTLNGQPAPSTILTQKSRNIVQVRLNPKHSYGLWKCSDPVCPRQSDGYCLENDPKTLEGCVNKETSMFTPSPPEKTSFDSYVIGGACSGLLVLLLVGAVFVVCRKRQSRSLSSSETTKEPEIQGTKHSAVPEGSPERRNREARTVVDHSSTEGGSEGIQYSTLQFMETGGVEIHMDKDTVTYEELCSCD